MKKWWLWTAIAVVVAGAATATALALRERGTEKPLPGDVGPGGVVYTLEIGR